MKNNIILIGFMGSGKSTVGLELARQLDFSFCDTDALIEEKEQTSISNIFAAKGEEYFRELETALLQELLEGREQRVIATGGGLPLREKNAALLKELGLAIYLKVTKDTVLKRLEGDTTRPLLAGEQVEEKIEKLLAYREPLYEIAAHIPVRTDEKSVEEIAEEIIHNYAIMEKHKNK